MNTNISKPLIATLLAAICSLAIYGACFAAAAPTPNLYQVDLLIFQHDVPGIAKSEALNPAAVNPNWRNYPAPEFQSGSSALFNILTKRLSIHPNYKILMKVSWQQFLPKRRKFSLLHLTNEGSVDITSPRIDGIIAFNKLNFFTAKINLIISVPTENGSASYQIQQARRLRLNELNYIDHPMFGILIDITPTEQK